MSDDHIDDGVVAGFVPGVYKHYRHGDLYRAICIVRHHETRRAYVLYCSLALGSLNIRPLAVQGEDSWNDIVTVNGAKVFRFTKLRDEDQPR